MLSLEMHSLLEIGGLWADCVVFLVGSGHAPPTERPPLAYNSLFCVPLSALTASVTIDSVDRLSGHRIWPPYLDVTNGWNFAKLKEKKDKKRRHTKGHRGRTRRTGGVKFNNRRCEPTFLVCIAGVVVRQHTETVPPLVHTPRYGAQIAFGLKSLLG